MTASGTLKLYGAVRPGCYADGVALRPGDWTIWEPGPAQWRLVAVWRSEAERDVALAAMGFAVRDGFVYQTVDARLVEAELVEIFENS